jgi:hypothetical protein
MGPSFETGHHSNLEAAPMTTFLRYVSFLLLGFATLAIVMMMIIVGAEAKENKSNTGTPIGAKSLIAPRSDRSDDIAQTSGDAPKAGAKAFIAPRSDRGDDIAQTSGDSNKGGGDTIGRPRQIIVEDAPMPLPAKKIEVAKREEITLPAPKSLPATKLLTSEAAEDAAPETETAPALPAPQAEAPIEAAPAPKLTSDSYHTAYRHSFYGHAYGYGYSDDDYDGCE